MWGRRSSAPRRQGRLAERRRARHRLALAAAAFALIALLGALDYGLWQKAVRISSVEIRGEGALLPGPDPSGLAQGALHGSYLGLIPRDSAFFYPAHAIRAAILAAHPEVASVSIARRGLGGLSLRVAVRTAVGRWCGSTYSPPAAAPEPAPLCYLYDPDGFIYLELPEPDASSTPPAIETLNAFTLYAPLAGGAGDPLHATIARAAQLPDAFAFARQLATLGSAASALVLRGDEADILLASGTRVTYVIGHEQDAYAALVSAKGDLDLASGALDYIDLRFPGKVYLKKRGE